MHIVTMCRIRPVMRNDVKNHGKAELSADTIEKGREKGRWNQVYWVREV